LDQRDATNRGRKIVDEAENTASLSAEQKFQAKISGKECLIKVTLLISYIKGVQDRMQSAGKGRSQGKLRNGKLRTNHSWRGEIKLQQETILYFQGEGDLGTGIDE